MAGTGTAAPSFEDTFDRFSWYDGQAGTWQTHYLWGSRTNAANREAQVYLDPLPPDARHGAGRHDPFSVADGVLTIRSQRVPEADRHQPGDGAYTSGMISTAQSFTQTYGYFEMRAQLPEGKALWPAFWLLPANGTWPPEVDIMEMLGNDPARYYVAAHTAQSGAHTHQLHGVEAVALTRTFNVFALSWSPDELVWCFNGREVFRTATPADMHQPMYIVANLAVGGIWPGPPDAATPERADMRIDYIRAYAHDGPQAGACRAPKLGAAVGTAPDAQGLAAAQLQLDWLDLLA